MDNKLKNEIIEIIQQQPNCSKLNFDINIVDQVPLNAHQFPTIDSTFKKIDIICSNTSFASFFTINDEIKNIYSENIGNKIEANEYLTLELEKHRSDIWNRPDFSLQLLLDGTVTFFHWISSNHSSNWLLALFWIFILSVCTNKFLGHELSVNYIFQYINILSSVNDFNKSYPAMILNKVILGYLYYQFLTAVRKDTRK